MNLLNTPIPIIAALMSLLAGIWIIQIIILAPALRAKREADRMIQRQIFKRLSEGSIHSAYRRGIN